MYAFAQRSDTRVVDEPFYGYYLAHTPAREYHPGADEILATMETDGDRVIKNITTANDRPVLFYKQMTHHLLDLKLDFLAGMCHVLLTRDPKEMIHSFAKVIAHPQLKDLGYADQTRLMKGLEVQKIPFCVIDAAQLLQQPEKVLRSLCNFLAIPFETTMLKWPRGPRTEDGVWAKFWYSQVHQSTGFLPYARKTIQLADHLLPLEKEARKHYVRLMDRHLEIE